MKYLGNNPHVPRIPSGEWYQNTTYTSSDGFYRWLPRGTPDSSVFSITGTYSERLTFLQAGMYFISANLLLGGNLSANTRYDVQLRRNGGVTYSWLGHTESTNGYFKVCFSIPMSLGVNDYITLYSTNTAAMRYGSSGGDWSRLEAVKLSS